MIAEVRSQACLWKTLVLNKQYLLFFFCTLVYLFISQISSELQCTKHGSLICELSLSGKFFKKTELCISGLLLLPSVSVPASCVWKQLGAHCCINHRTTMKCQTAILGPEEQKDRKTVGLVERTWQLKPSWTALLKTWYCARKAFRFKPLQGSILLLTKSCFKLSFQIHTLGKHIVESDLTSSECEIQVFQGTIYYILLSW